MNILITPSLEPVTTSPFDKHPTDQTDCAGNCIVSKFSPLCQNLTVRSSSDVTNEFSPAAIHLAILKEYNYLKKK